VDQPLEQRRLSMSPDPWQAGCASVPLSPASAGVSSAVAEQGSTQPLGVTPAVVVKPELQDDAHAKRGRDGDGGAVDEGEDRGAPKAR
jgi:hypothetical protein